MAEEWRVSEPCVSCFGQLRGVGRNEDGFILLHCAHCGTLVKGDSRARQTVVPNIISALSLLRPSCGGK